MLNAEQENIFLAIINQDLEKLKVFLESDSDKDCSFTDDDGNTLLHFASDRPSAKSSTIVQKLLECGCDPQAVNARFETPLDRAKQNNNIPAMAVMKHYINIQNKEIQDYI